MDPVARLPRLVLALQAHSWRRAVDLAEDLGVSPRTIYRDMGALAEAGVPVVAVPGKGYRLAETRLLPPLSFTVDEAVAMLLALDAAAHPDDPAAQAARTRLEAALPVEAHAERDARRTRRRDAPANVFAEPGAEAVLVLVQQAVAEQRTLRFQDGAHQEPRTVDAYGLLEVAGQWRLVGYDHDHHRVEGIPLARIGDPVLLDATFERPAAYARASLPPSPGVAARVRFATEAARWVRQALPPFAEVVEDDGDGLHVTLRAAREADLLPWLLGWGAHAQVLEPDALRRRLAREAAAVLDQYRAAPWLLDFG